MEHIYFKVANNFYLTFTMNRLVLNKCRAPSNQNHLKNKYTQIYGECDKSPDTEINNDYVGG